MPAGDLEAAGAVHLVAAAVVEEAESGEDCRQVVHQDDLHKEAMQAVQAPEEWEEVDRPVVPADRTAASEFGQGRAPAALGADPV